ncbi:hypothetical protein C0J52_08887 [Blattella germanica]|nr:hypothetical protein C0J52_08887 [Blattella germanica]
MDYKVYKVFELEDFNRLLNGVKVAQCMGSSSFYTLSKEAEAQNLSKLEDLSISEKLFCSFCKTSFSDQAQQRLHYKLDWHRYNLKQKLNGLKSISEEKFSQQADDLSSISGSSSESESEDESESSDSATKQNKDSSTATDKIKDNAKYEELRLLATRHAKVFFENADGQIVSIYRCLLHGKKDIPENDEQLIPLALKVTENPTWAIIMLGGGHFAAAIFQGKEALVHKTFHCYTVRAKQGGAQSSRDGRSGGSHPKSAGASLRRYNEAALVQHVQDIMESWSQQLSSCSLILYRAVGPHNRNVLFSGRNPPLNKLDPRLRTIPFATRRATFSEVKRVHDILASLELYGNCFHLIQRGLFISEIPFSGSAVAFQTSFPQSPRKRSKSQVPSEGTTDSSSDITTPDNKENKKSPPVGGEKVDSNCSSNENKTPSQPKRSSKPVIDRAKPRKSPHRPLPGIVNAILAKSSSESDMSEHQFGFGSQIVGEDVEVSFHDLQEFDDTVPQEMKDRRKGKDKKLGKKQKKQVVKELYSEPMMALRTKLWAACRLGDSELLINSLQAAQPIEEEPENCANEVDGSDKNVITRVEYLKCLNENVGDSKETLLHVAAQGGHMDIIRALMEAGCDPCVKNKKSQTPYVSQISGPLTDDMEQKMAEKRKEQRKAKKEREKEKKKEEEVKKEEEAEKERFLRLSDREKCAIDITGKVPFEYDIHRFCSMNCLKQHRLKLKGASQNK